MKRLLLCLMLCGILTLFCACTATPPPDETLPDTPPVTEAPTDPPTEADTEAETETVPDTGYPIDLMTVSGTPIQSFSLYIQPDAPDSVRSAAAELAAYLKTATGYDIPTLPEGEHADHELVIGVTDRDTAAVTAARESLGAEGYAIVQDGDSLHLTGADTAGTVYGIYSFMEDYLGVRFYATDFTVVRDTPVVSIEAGMTKTFTPVFMSRDTYWYGVSVDQTLANHLKDNSGYIPALENGVSYAGTLVHSLAALSEMPHVIGRQPCLTDENVYQTVLKNVRAWLDAHPNAKIITVSQNDSYADQLGCQCENCKAIDDAEGTPMGSLLTFVNRIADAIKEDYPDVYVDTLAYRYTRKAPKTVRPRDNVIIRLCSIECCFCHPMTDETCPDNVAFRQDIEAWSAICENLYVWDYTTNFMYYLAPFPNLDVLWENVRFFKEHNVIGVFEQGNYTSKSGEFGELRAYLLSKLLWDPDMTKEDYYRHMDEFLQDYYGPGWEKIRAYIDFTSAKSAKFAHAGIYDPTSQLIPFVDDDGKRNIEFTRDLLAQWEEALALCETEEQTAHMEKSMIQIYYYCHTIGKQSERRDFLKKVYELCEKHGITQYREGVPMPDSSHNDEIGSLG